MGVYLRVDAQIGIYHNSDLGLISLSSDGSTWVTIADKNLGATNVGDYGNYYQRGNNYAFPQGDYSNTSSATVDAGSYGPDNYYNSNVFRTTAGWDSSNNKDLWGEVTGTNTARKGPCNDGFHIPKMSERDSINAIGQTLGAWTSSSGTGIVTYLLMPLGGYKTSGSAALNTGVRGGYWTTSIASTDTLRQMIYYWATSNSTSNQGTNWALPIRPFKNEAVQPDATRTVLYQPS